MNKCVKNSLLAVLPIVAFSCGKSEKEENAEGLSYESVGSWSFQLPAPIEVFSGESLVAGELRRSGYVFTATSDRGIPLTFEVTAKSMPSCPDFELYNGVVMATGILDLEDLLPSRYFLVQTSFQDFMNVSFHARVKDEKSGCLYLSMSSREAFDPDTDFNRRESSLLKGLLSIANTTKPRK